MKNRLPRREFILKTSAACMGGCMLLSAKGAVFSLLQDDQTIDPGKLCYCSYKCPADCHFLVASLKNDSGLKKAAYEEWGLKERLGLEFDQEKIFCFGCKPGEQPEGPVLNHCTVRGCAIERGYQACIQCDDLKECDKDLWTRFPQFHQAVMEMQVKYRAQV